MAVAGILEMELPNWTRKLQPRLRFFNKGCCTHDVDCLSIPPSAVEYIDCAIFLAMQSVHYATNVCSCLTHTLNIPHTHICSPQRIHVRHQKLDIIDQDNFEHRVSHIGLTVEASSVVESWSANGDICYLSN
jgi:hypothetical protein